MAVTVRTVDTSQYENRLRQWDYDIIVASWGESLSPGNEQRGFWGSQAADQPGSRNVVGIKNPAIDKLIERVIFAKRPRRAGRGDQGARPRAVVELLRRAAMELSVTSARRAGIASAIRTTMPKYGASAFPDRLVVGRGQSGQGAAAFVTMRYHAATR